MSADLSYKEQLLRKIASKQATVGVIGLGYVGLPLALVFDEAGFPVLGFDIDPTKPEALNRGESYIRTTAKTIARLLERHENEVRQAAGRNHRCRVRSE